MDDQLLRLKATILIQAADISALLTILKKRDPDADQQFLKARNFHLHALLEQYEDKDPAFAAMLQATIDKYSQNHPFDY